MGGLTSMRPWKFERQVVPLEGPACCHREVVGEVRQVAAVRHLAEVALVAGLRNHPN
jgi:hypothetical protein